MPHIADVWHENHGQGAKLTGDIIVTPLMQIIDERGKVMHVIKKDMDIFARFGSISSTALSPGTIDAWTRRTAATTHWAVVTGLAKVVLCDQRNETTAAEKYRELFLGPANYCLLTVPAGVWCGLKAIGTEPAVIVTCSSLRPSEDTVERCADLPYDWHRL